MLHATENRPLLHYCKNGNLLYAHIFDGNIGALPVPGIQGKVKKVRLLSEGSEMKLIDTWNIKEFPDYAFINFGPNDVFTYPIPDDIDTVVEFELV